MSRTVVRIIFASALIGHVATAQAADTAAVYANRCAFCHGTSGKGDGPAGVALKPPPKDLSDPEYWKSADPENLKAIITNGKPGTAMIAFKDTLTPEQIAALVEHLKTFNAAR
jgi:high-affinity iron transporter